MSLHDLATCLNCGRVFDATDPDGCPCHGDEANIGDDKDVTAGPKGLLFRCTRCGAWTDLDGNEPCDCEPKQLPPEGAPT